MELIKPGREKPRGRPRKVAEEAQSETTLAIIEPSPDEAKPKRTRKKPELETALAIPEPPQEPKPKRVRKKPDPETAIESEVNFTSRGKSVNFKALRAPPKPPKLERAPRPYATLHDRYDPFSHFAIV